MIRRLQAVLVLVGGILLLCPNASSAQALDATPTVSNTIPIEGSTADSDHDIEIAILRAQLETMKEYDQRLLETVGWSLGIAGGVLAIIVGYSALSTFVLTEREKKAITAELENVIQKRFLEERERIEERFEEETENLEEIARHESMAATRVIKRELHDLKGDWFLYKLRLKDSEAEKHLHDGAYKDGIEALMEMIDITIELNIADVMAPTLMDRLLTVFSSAKAAGVALAISAHTIARFTKQLESLPPERGSSGRRVLQKMEA